MPRLAPRCALFALALLSARPGAAGEPQDDSNGLAEVAAAKLGNGDYAGAVENAELAIRRYPYNVRAYNLLSEAHNKLKEYSKADAAAVRGLTAMPKRMPGREALYENLAFAQLHMGKPEEAAHNAGEALRYSSGKSASALALRAFAEEVLELDAAKKGARGEQRSRAQAKLADIRRAAEIAPLQFSELLVEAERGGRIYADDEPAAERYPMLQALASSPRGAWIGLAALMVACLGFALTVWTRDGSASRPVLSTAAPLLSGSAEGLLAGKYELRRVIGKGGMGEVWEGRDASLGRLVAIKRMTATIDALGSQGKEYFVKEARTLGTLDHPAIVKIYEIHDLPDGIHLIFEMVTGKTVQQILVEEKRLGLGRIKEILRPVCEALEYAHGRAIVHRDLKPSNIMVTDQGWVKVMDFGIARRNAEALALDSAGRRTGPGVLKTHTIIGTPGYMPPEALQGVVSAGSDVYALGVCLYEMATGELPFGEAGLLPRTDYRKPSERAPGLPAELDLLVEESLAPELEERLPSVRDFLSRLAALPDLARRPA